MHIYGIARLVTHESYFEFPLAAHGIIENSHFLARISSQVDLFRTGVTILRNFDIVLPSTNFTISCTTSKHRPLIITQPELRTILSAFLA